jgi:predicted transcriptional regulator
LKQQNRTVVSAWVSRDLAEAVARVAREDERTTSSVLRLALRQYAALHEVKERKELAPA